MGYFKQTVLGLFVVIALLMTLYSINQKKACSHISDLSTYQEKRSSYISEMSTSKSFKTIDSGENIIVMFTGRWKFLRINFPYIYRDLRVNGGVLDKVWYMMVNYDRETETNLKQLTQEANTILGSEVFVLRYMGFPPGNPPKTYPPVYKVLFPDLIRNPFNRYFKMDDDIVYIHPGAFETMIDSKKSCENRCFMHFGNIVTNWRCSITHERMGLFNNLETNPKSLKFDYSPSGECGWKSSQCADVVLKTFLYHYKKKQLYKYTFEGCEQLVDRKRFSINFFMLDKDLINIEALLRSGPIGVDDEKWWTQTYSPNPVIKEPNCIVGGTLVVHFSYYVTMDTMLKKGYLKEFEDIVQTEIDSKLPNKLWTLSDYGI